MAARSVTLGVLDLRQGIVAGLLAAEHWGLAVDGRFYEVTGQGKETEHMVVVGPWGTVAQAPEAPHCRRFSRMSKDYDRTTALPATTARTYPDIEAWIKQWVMDNPRYDVRSIRGKNCQDFCQEFYRWLTGDSLDCVRETQAGAIKSQVVRWGERVLGEFALTAVEWAVTRAAPDAEVDQETESVVRDAVSAGVSILRYNSGLHSSEGLVRHMELKMGGRISYPSASVEHKAGLTALELQGAQWWQVVTRHAWNRTLWVTTTRAAGVEFWTEGGYNYSFTCSGSGCHSSRWWADTDDQATVTKVKLTFMDALGPEL